VYIYTFILCRWKFSVKGTVADFIQIDFYSKKGKVRFLRHPLGDLEVTYALHL